MKKYQCKVGSQHYLQNDGKFWLELTPQTFDILTLIRSMRYWMLSRSNFGNSVRLVEIQEVDNDGRVLNYYTPNGLFAESYELSYSHTVNHELMVSDVVLLLNDYHTIAYNNGDMVPPSEMSNLLTNDFHFLGINTLLLKDEEDVIKCKLKYSNQFTFEQLKEQTYRYCRHNRSQDFTSKLIKEAIDEITQVQGENW